MDDAEFEEAAGAGFPFGCGADEVFDMIACCAFEHPSDCADETAFAAGEVGPPVLSFRMCCFHAREGKTGRGTKTGPYSKIFEF